MKKGKLPFSPMQLLALGFAAMILLGAILLTLPISNRSFQRLSFFDALFTATSATCVTGLIVQDTYTQFSHFGQFVILLMIQIGGLGFMSVSVLIFIAAGKRIGLTERSILVEAVNTTQLGGIVRLVKHILIGTAIVETAGAILLSLRFVPMFGLGEGIWCGIFHSVSAFCNAGFDILGRLEPFGSLRPFAGDALVNLVIMALILIGGIGFIVWEDVVKNGVHFSKYRLHSKIMLCATLALVLIPFILFLWIENNNALAGRDAGEKILVALFQVVTPRTAGFETVGMGSLTQAGALLVMALMFIGGGAGSTAGGVKVSTAATVLLTAFAYLRQKEDVNVFRRRLEEGTIKKALCAITLYILLTACACFIITIVQRQPFSAILFETLSAIGTVGLSTGITQELLPLSRIVVMILMYTGRVGSLSLGMALLYRKEPVKMKWPEEIIIV